MSAHAVRAAWVAAGLPEPCWQGKATTQRQPPDFRHGVCALTGEVGDVVDARHVVSGTFTAADLLPYRDRDPSGLAFGAAAAWAFRLRPAMQRPHGLVAGRVGEAVRGRPVAAGRILNPNASIP